MPLFSAYSSDLATALLPLLDPAGTIPVSSAWVPSSYNLVTTFTTLGGSAGGTQGLVLTATLSIGGNNTPVAILAFGVRWADFLYGAYTSSFTSTQNCPGYLNLGGGTSSLSDHADLLGAMGALERSLAEVDHLAARVSEAAGHPLVALARSAARQPQWPVPAQVGSTGAIGQILTSPATAYGNARTAIWASLASLVSVPGYGSGFPLLCVGTGPAAAIAQLAALDLRPGQTGPAGATQMSPASDIGCYCFSAAPLGDGVFTDQANAALPGIYPINAPATDLWTVNLGLAAQLQVPGQAQTVSVTVTSTADTPWYDRTPAVYGQAFGGASPTVATGGSLTPPTGFDQRLASVLAQLTVSAYAFCQHPTGSVSAPSPYQMVASVSPSGQAWTNLPWAVVFSNAAANILVVAIRGPATLGETVTVNGSGYPIRPTWLTNGRITDGVVNLASLLADTLAIALSGQSASTAVYYTGHDYGAAVAAVLAYQVKAQVVTNLPTPTAVYGFGCQPFGDYVFTHQVYPPMLGSVTFQVQRPAEVLTLRTGSGFTTVGGTAVALSGGEASTANSTTYHAAALYAQLLNASAS